MSSKKTILHIINYLGRGGAEVMLVKVLKELKEYNNIVVTLNPENHFGEEFKCDLYYCLNMGSFVRFPINMTLLRFGIKLGTILRSTRLFRPSSRGASGSSGDRPARRGRILP